MLIHRIVPPLSAVLNSDIVIIDTETCILSPVSLVVILELFAATGRAMKGPGILIPLNPVIFHPSGSPGALHVKVCVLLKSTETVPSGVSVPVRYRGV